MVLGNFWYGKEWQIPTVIHSIILIKLQGPFIPAEFYLVLGKLLREKIIIGKMQV